MHKTAVPGTPTIRIAAPCSQARTGSASVAKP